MIYIHWIYLLLYMAIMIPAIITVLMDNRQPAKTMAWILVLAFMPFVGIIFYIFFGQNTRKERLISDRSMDQLTKRSMLEFAEQENLHIPANNKPLMNLFTNQNWAFPFKDNQVDIFTDGYEFIFSLLYNIGKAQHHIHLDTYIFEDDALGYLVADALIDKAEQGVEVRLIYDDVGCWKVKDAFFERMREAGIDVHHLAVTGCSRLGKAALVAGAFDARIALVIPQESGSGGASNWRSAAKDSEAQPLSHACQEAAWFRSSLCNYGNRINDLPTDHHYLTGMVAPRALLVLDNTGWVWLGEGASYANAMSTVEIFKALGAEKDFTYSKAANHMHCSFPAENKDELTAFVKKYLFDDKTQNTGKIEAKGVSYNAADWQDWTTPTLN